MMTINTELGEHLDQIQRDLLAMVDVVVHRIGEVTTALLERDVDRADALIVNDNDLFRLHQEVEERCADALVTGSVAGRPLRAIIAALEINSAVERAGALTTNIAKAAGRLQGSRADDAIRDLIARMGREARHVFEQAGVAYRRSDAELAATIDELDDVLDALHRDFIQAVIHGASQGHLHPQQSLQLALIGRFYERIGDHAERIGERTRFVVDGWSPEPPPRPKPEPPPALDAVADVVTSRGLAVIDSIAEERRIDATRRDFVANVSHELKTPIAAIALLAETLASAGPDDDRDRLTDHITREVARVSAIIDDLLELTRLEEFASPVGPVRVDEVVRQALDVVRAFAESREIELAVGGMPCGIEVDGERRQLVRAIVNLVDNAVRYSDPGDVVSVGVERLVDRVEIRVADTGIGIPRPDLERIFERFYRVDRARSRDTGGTGLGLSIVRHVMDNHGGRVVVESKPGVGSTFSLQLPIRGEES